MTLHYACVILIAFMILSGRRTVDVNNALIVVRENILCRKVYEVLRIFSLG